MRKLMAALVCSLFVVAGSFGCSSEEPAAGKETCARDAECPHGLHCTPQHVCKQCAFDTQCPDSERCDRGSCVGRVACSSNQDCPSAANPICDVALKECVGCAADTDCDPPQRCFEHACQIVNGCRSESDCDESQTCQRGQCVAWCLGDSDCTGIGLLCDYSSQTCKQCLVNADCPSAYHCAAGSCERDICTAGASRCTSNEHGVELCAPAGDRWLTLFCASSQSCDKSSGKAACSGWLCTPGDVGCSTDARRVEVCADDGSAIRVDHECAADQVCSAGECKDEVCTPGLSYCKAGAVYRCSDDGTTSASTQECDANSYCDQQTARCVKRVCVPGTVSCDDNEAVRCRADGSGFDTTAQCGKSSICTDGACRELLCEPNARSCDAQGRVLLCNANGTAGAVVDTCDATQHCVESASRAACVSGTCIANQATCNGDSAVKCNADGSAFEAAATDCAAVDQTCYGGACRSKLCTPNTVFCEQGNSFICIQNGSAKQLFDTCTSTEYCDDASGACKARICSPSTAGCNDQVAATCNADGSGYSSTGAVDCAQSGKVCVNGACQPKLCTPNATQCQGGDVYRCNAQGTATALDADCTAAQHCTQAGNLAFCASNACVPGNMYCNGNVAAKCLADGSGFEPGTDCGAQVCVSGACQTPKLCVPGSMYCNGNVSAKCLADGSGFEAGTDCGAQVCVSGACQTPKFCVPDSLTCTNGNSYVCNSAGSAYALKQTCTALQSCSGGVCIPDVCPAGAQACLGEVLGVCSSDGSALASTSIDCNASHQACTLGGCVATVTDVLGSSTTQTSGSNTLLMMHGDFVYVSTARRVKLMQQPMTTPYNAKPLRWVIYRSDAAFGPYQMIFDQLAPIIPYVQAMQSSTAMDVPLVAGKYYYLATVTDPGASFMVESSTAQRYISFGHVLGSATSSFATLSTSFSITSFNASFAPLTLTTALP